MGGGWWWRRRTRRSSRAARVATLPHHQHVAAPEFAYCPESGGSDCTDLTHCCAPASHHSAHCRARCATVCVRVGRVAPRLAPDETSRGHLQGVFEYCRSTLQADLGDGGIARVRPPPFDGMPPLNLVSVAASQAVLLHLDGGGAVVSSHCRHLLDDLRRRLVAHVPHVHRCVR